MVTKRTFTRDELEEIGVPWEGYVYNEQVDERRWSTVHECVFRSEDKLWRVTYQLPATEMQECDVWFDENPVGAVQVEPYEVTVTKYRPVTEIRADEPITNRCAVCGDVIDLIDGKWNHRPGLRSPHDPEPANLTASRGAE